MFKSEHLVLNFLKTDDRFEISTFEVRYWHNFVKIGKLILLCPKYPNLGIWAQNLWENNIRLEISIFKIGYRQNIVKILESWYFFVQNTQIWAFGTELWKTKGNRKFKISPIWKFWVVSGHFAIYLCRFGRFWIVLAGRMNFGTRYDLCYEIFQIFKPELLKTFKLVLNLSLISNKTQNL